MPSSYVPAGSRRALTSLLACTALLTAVSGAQAQDRRTVSGQITDENGNPLPGATVGVWTFQNPNVNTNEAPPDDLAHADANGKWSAVLPGNLTSAVISAFAPGRSLVTSRPRFTLEDAKPAALDFKLLPVHPIRLKLVDWNNHPVPGMSVRLENRARPGLDPTFYGRDFPGYESEVTTDAGGQAVVPFGSAGESLTVNIHGTDFQTIQATLGVPTDDGLAIRLFPGGGIKGRLVDTAGQPLSKRRVFISGTETAAVTGGDGTFFLSGLDAVPSWLGIEGKDLVLPIRQVDVIRGTSVDIQDVVATPGTLVSGTVTDKRTGKPFANGSYMTVSLARASGGSRWRKYVNPDKEGNFQLRFPQGEFLLSIGANDFNGASKKVTVNVQDEKPIKLDITLDPTEPPLRAEPAPLPPSAKPAANPEPPDYIYGKALLPDGTPAAGAMVTVLQSGRVIRDGRTGADGKFAIGPLVGDMGPNGNVTGLVKGEAGKPAPKIFVRASSADFTSRSVIVDPTSDAPMTLRLASLAKLRLRVVTSDGHPIPGASVTPRSLKFYVGDDDQPWQTAAPGTFAPLPAPAQTDARGEVTFEGLPSEGLCRLTVTKPGFADFTHVVALPRKDVPELVLCRPAVVEGRLLFGDEVLSGKNINVKIQSGGQAQLWRTAVPDADGRFLIDNLAPTAQLNEGRLIINLNLIKENSEIAPGLTAAYVKAGQNWNVILSDTRHGDVRKWICYVDLLPELMEGDDTVFDFKMTPLVRITGKLIPRENKPIPTGYVVSAPDPEGTHAYGYEPVGVNVDKDGNFEIWVPAEKPATLELRPGQDRWNQPTASLAVEPIHLGQARQVEMKLGAVSDPVTSRYALRGAFRVLGPDNATVPRVTFTYRPPNAPRNEGETSSYSTVDGLLSIYTSNDLEGGSLRLNSPLLNAPLTVQVDNTKIQTIRLDRLPETVPTTNIGSNYGQPATVPTPSQISIGDEVPEFSVDKWLFGGPVRPEDLKGKITICIAEVQAIPSLLPSIERHPGKIAIVIFTRNYARTGDVVNSTLTRGLPDDADLRARVKSTVAAIAIDPQIERDWRGANMYRLHAGYGGTVIGPDGKLAVVGLYGNELAAKIDQLAADMGAN